MSMLGVECPACGDMQTGVTKAGLDSEGHRIRMRKCRNCDHSFTTLEVAIPFVFNNMDVAKPDREVGRLRKRGPTYRAAPRRVHAYFDVSRVTGDSRRGGAGSGLNVRLVPARQSNICRKGLHRLDKANVYLRKDGSRVCRACARDTNRKYRQERHARFPVIAAEEREANKLRMRASRERLRLETRGEAA